MPRAWPRCPPPCCRRRVRRPAPRPGPEATARLAAAAGARGTARAMATSWWGSATAMAAACRPKSRPRATAPRPALLSPQRVCYLPELPVGQAAGAEEIRHARTLELRIAHASGFVPDQIALAQRAGRVVNPVLRRP